MSLKLLLKTVVTLGIFVLLYFYVDTKLVLEEIAKSDKLLILLAIVLQFLSTLVAAFRWNLIMKILGFKESFYFYFRSYFKGSFFNQLLPSNIGGDAIRILDLRGAGYGVKESFFGILIDRVFGILALLFVGLIAGFYAKALIPEGLYETINYIFIAGILGVLFITLIHRSGVFKRFRFLGFFLDMSKSFYTIFRETRNFIKQFFYSILVHIFSIFSIFAIANAVGIDKEAVLFLTLIPIVILLMAIPLSLAGWGIREGAMVGLFTLVGVQKELILSVSLIYGFVVIITIIPGFFYWAIDKKRLI